MANPGSSTRRISAPPRRSPPRQGPDLPCPSLRRFARLWTARRSLARRRANRSVGCIRGALAGTSIRPFAGPLPLAGSHPPHLSIRTQDRGGRLVWQNDSAFALGYPAGTLHLASLLGRF